MDPVRMFALPTPVIDSSSILEAVSRGRSTNPLQLPVRIQLALRHRRIRRGLRHSSLCSHYTSTGNAVMFSIYRRCLARIQCCCMLSEKL